MIIRFAMTRFLMSIGPSRWTYNPRAASLMSRRQTLLSADLNSSRASGRKLEPSEQLTTSKRRPTRTEQRLHSRGNIE